MHIDQGGRSHLPYKAGVIILILLFATFFIPGANAQAAGDPDHTPRMFRADPEHSGVNDDGGVMPTGNLNWSFATGDRVYSSPAVVDGVVYIGSDDNRVYAIDGVTGEEVWNYTTGGRVIASPAVTNGIVYVGSYDKKLYALDEGTGEKLWDFQTGGWVTSSPVVKDGVVYSGSLDDKLYALNATTGVMLWNSSLGEFSSVYSSPAVSNGFLYATGGNQTFYALDIRTGNAIWNFTTGSPLYSSPAVIDSTVYVGSWDGNVYALNASTGDKIWNATIGQNSEMDSSPAVENGIVYIGSNDNNVYALNASSGALMWNYTTGSVVYSSPTVANGVVYVGSWDHNLYALDAGTGTKIWNYTTGSPVYSSPAVANGLVYFGSLDGNVYAVGSSPQPVSPVANFSANLTFGIPPMTVQFTDFSTGTQPLTYQWNFGDGSQNETVQDPVYTYTEDGTYNVTLTVSNDAGAGTFERPGYITAMEPVIVGGGKAFYLVHSNVDGAEVYFNHDSFEGVIQNGTLLVQTCPTCTPVFSFTVRKCGYIALTQTNNKHPADNQTVDLYANLTAPKEPLIADFLSNVTSGLAPLDVAFTSHSIGIVESWNWSFGDGTYSEEAEPVHTYPVDGVYTVGLSESNSACQNSTLEKEGYISVNTIITGGGKAWYLVHSNVDGAEVYFNHDSFEGVIQNSTLLVQTCPTCTPVFSFTVRKCGYIALTQPNNNYPGNNQTVDLYANLTAPKEPLIADFSGNVTSGQAPLYVAFTSHSIGLVESWNWSFGDGTYSEEAQPVHTYTVDGVYTVGLSESNSACQNYTIVKKDFITVSVPKPTFQANFTVSPTSGMAPLTVKCTDTSIGKPTWFSYNFGDGITMSGPNPVHTYRFPGTYSITQTISKYNSTKFTIMSSSVTKTDVITVGKVPFVMPVAQFSASPTQGTVPLTVAFTDHSTGNPTFFNYDFGDGINMTGPNQVHIYRQPGTYNVTLIVMKNDAASGMFVANSSVQTGLVVVNST